MQSEMSPNKMDRQRMIAFISDILPKIKKEREYGNNNQKQSKAGPGGLVHGRKIATKMWGSTVGAKICPIVQW